MDSRLKASREYDPLIVSQVLQCDMFLASHLVSYWKNDIWTGSSKWHFGDLSIGGRFWHESQVEVARQDTANQFAGKLT
jgi:hypothetical protein